MDIENKKESPLEGYDYCKHVINSPRIEISIGRQYSFNELTEIWTAHKIMEGTVINVFQTNQEITLLCEGRQPNAGCYGYKHKYVQTRVQNDGCSQSISNLYHNSSCGFHLQFLINHHHHHFTKNNENPYDLSTKTFTLQSICILHSPKCIASNTQFIYERNTNFIKSFQQLLQELIYRKYQIDRKPLLPVDYLNFSKNFFGFDFLYHGLDQNIQQKSKTNDNNSNKVKYFKNKLKKTYDNVVKDARDIYQIPSSKKQFQKQRKSKYRVNTPNYLQSTPSNQLSQKNLYSSPNQQYLDDEDSQYQPFSKRLKK